MFEEYLSRLGACWDILKLAWPVICSAKFITVRVIGTQTDWARQIMNAELDSAYKKASHRVRATNSANSRPRTKTGQFKKAK